MRRCTILPLLFVLALGVAPASAQQVSLTIHDGVVNLDAQGASIRQILDAWSRIGGTKIVNGERVTGGPVTLKLVNTPEREALEVILRSAAGYMAVPRAANGTPGESLFDRIMVLPTSTAAQTAAKSPPPSAPPNPFLRGGRQAQGDEDEPAVADAEPDPAQPPVFTFPNQGQPENAGQNPFMQQGGVNQPFGQPAQGAPFGQPAQGAPFGQPSQSAPFGQPAQNSPFAPTPVPPPTQAAPVQTPFGQVQQAQPQFGQQQTPAVNPFAAALAAAQQQQQQQQQQYPNVAPPAPGTFTIIGSPTPGVVAQPQPTQQNPFAPRPPGQQR